VGHPGGGTAGERSGEEVVIRPADGAHLIGDPVTLMSEVVWRRQGDARIT